MTDPLTRLAITYGTDKFGYHDYTPNYHALLKHLRDQPIRLLEIGVGGYQDADRGGESLETWRDYFPKGQITGIDIQEKKLDLGDRVTVLKGSQVDPDFLQMLVREHGPFDVIIDDGSHKNEHVLTSFELLFPTLVAGGIYVVEDVQTAFFPRFGGSLEMTAPNSVGYFARMAEQLQCDGQEYAPLLEQVAGIERFHNMVALHKAAGTGCHDMQDELAEYMDQAISILTVGGGDEIADWQAHFPKALLIDLLVDGKKPAQKDVNQLLDEHGPFDVVLDLGDINTNGNLGRLFPALKTGGCYLARTADPSRATFFTNLFIEIDHREIKVNFPDARINPWAQEIYAMKCRHGMVSLQKGINDYPSNFAFDFEHPKALEAFDLMQQVLEESATERGLLLFTDLMTRAGRADRATRMLEKLGKIEATSRSYFNMAVRQNKIDQNWDEAMILCQKAVELYPEDYRIRSQLGAAYSKVRDWSSAAHEFARAVDLAPRDPLVRIQLANALSRLGQIDDAVASAETAVELAPANAGHKVQLGRLLVDAGRYDKAISTLKGALEINDEVPNAYRQLSRAFHQLGRDDEALEVAKTALSLRPDNQEYRRWQEKLQAA